jgi:hypothetical protein
LKLSKKAPTQAPQQVVDLPLTLSEAHIVEAANSHYLEYLDPELDQGFDIESVLVVCWLLVIHCFSPVRNMYLAFYAASNICCIDGKRQGVNSRALEFSSELPLKDLVRDYFRIKVDMTLPDSEEESTSDEKNHLLPSVVHYARERKALQEAPLPGNSTVFFTRVPPYHRLISSLQQD